MRRRSLVGLCVSVVLLVSAAACTDDGDEPEAGGSSSTEVVTGGVMRLGTPAIESFDPSQVAPVDQASMIALDLLFDPLPELAELRPNGDFTVWTAVLDDRAFSDGSLITAQDALFTLQRLAGQGSGSLAGTRLDLIAGYQEFAVDGTADSLSGLRAIDDSTLEITLVEPFVSLPALLASPIFGVVPEAVVSADPAAFAAEPVGSGPYQIAAVEGSVTTLERTLDADTMLDGYELVEFDSVASAYAAFVDGEVDWSLVPTAELASATEQFGDEHFTPFGAEIWFGINQNDPVYADVRFRRAILHAVDRAALAERVFPGRLALDGLVAEGVDGFVPDACGSACRYDPDEARRLLAEAFPDGTIPTVVLDTYDDSQQQALVQAMGAELQAVGIPVELRVQSFDEYRQFVTTGETGVFSFGWVGIVGIQDSYVGPPFISDSPDNVVGLSSPDLDAQIRSARATGLDADRQAQYQSIERQILELGVVVPIAQLTTNQVVADGFEGFVGELDGTFDVAVVHRAA